jgi:hypothetical protein
MISGHVIMAVILGKKRATVSARPERQHPLSGRAALWAYLFSVRTLNLVPLVCLRLHRGALDIEARHIPNAFRANRPGSIELNGLILG